MRQRCPTSLPPPGPHLAPPHIPPFDSAGQKLPVQHQQAAHPLRVGGQLGIHPSLWLKLGSGKLHKCQRWLEPPPRASTPPDARVYHRLSRTAYGRVPLPAVLNCSRATSPVNMSTTPIPIYADLVYHCVPCSVTGCSFFTHPVEYSTNTILGHTLGALPLARLPRRRAARSQIMMVITARWLDTKEQVEPTRF